MVIRKKAREGLVSSTGQEHEGAGLGNATERRRQRRNVAASNMSSLDTNSGTLPVEIGPSVLGGDDELTWKLSRVQIRGHRPGESCVRVGSLDAGERYLDHLFEQTHTVLPGHIGAGWNQPTFVPQELGFQLARPFGIEHVASEAPSQATENIVARLGHRISRARPPS